MPLRKCSVDDVVMCYNSVQNGSLQVSTTLQIFMGTACTMYAFLRGGQLQHRHTFTHCVGYVAFVKRELALE